MSDQLEPVEPFGSVEPEVAAYLRSRGNVKVPADLLARTVDRIHTEAVGTRPRLARWPAFAAVAAAVVLAVVTFTVGSRPNLLPDGSPRATAVSQASTGPSPTQSATSASSVPTEFPESVMGMPVVSIREVRSLIDEEQLDGLAVAVRGYWIQPLVHSCPAPGRFIAPLERWCSFDVFSDIGYAGWNCIILGQGQSECHGNAPPVGTMTLSPIALGDAGGMDVLSRSFRDATNGIPAVLIGHALDPRAWQCPTDIHDQCAREFVVDRVAWVAGETAEISQTDPSLAARMSVADVAAAVAPFELLTAQVLIASEAPGADPRLHTAGRDLVWVARSIGTNPPGSADQTRSVDVWLIDDATGGATWQLGLEMGSDYAPGRFLAQSEERGSFQGDDVDTFYRVELPDGSPVQDLTNGGWSSSEGSFRRRHPGLPSILEAGNYVVRAWRTTYDDRFLEEHPDECATEFTIGQLEEVRLEAAFPSRGGCEWRAPTFDDIG